MYPKGTPTGKHDYLQLVIIITMEIRVVTSPVSLKEVSELAQKQFGNLIKATVDVKKRMMAIGGELHADEEQLLLEKGSVQGNLWGINLYPAKFNGAGFIEFDSMINIRPSQQNMSREVEDKQTRQLISEIVSELIKDVKNL